MVAGIKGDSIGRGLLGNKVAYISIFKIRDQMQNKPASYPLIYIEWGDAISNTGWMSVEEAKRWGKEQHWLVKNIGWLLKETKDYILLAAKYSDENQDYGLLHKIPKTWIKTRQVVKLKNA